MKKHYLFAFILLIPLIVFIPKRTDPREYLIKSVLTQSAEGKLLLCKIDHGAKQFKLEIDSLIRELYLSGKKGKVERDLNSNYLVLSWETPKEESALKQYPKVGHAVTYELSGGRLGDNLLSYFHARFLAYKYNLSLQFVPFKYADFFHLEGDEDIKTLEKVVLHNEQQILDAKKPTLFVVPYFSECPFEFGAVDSKEFNAAPPQLFKVDWQDSGFQRVVQKSLTPKKDINVTPLPQDKITVGVHIRRGVKQKGGADSRTARRAFPLKFPPDSYYLEEIRRVASIFQGKKLYVFLFTDSPDSEKILKHYQSRINNPDIEFAIRANTTGDEAILEDFLSLAQFDCLILCQSNFSIVASKISNHALIITPTHSTTVRKFMAVDEIELHFDGSFLKK